MQDAFKRSPIPQLLPARQQLAFNDNVYGAIIVRSGVIDHCNRKLEQMFGYAPGELRGFALVMLFPSLAVLFPSLAEAVFDPAQTRQTNIAFSGELGGRNKRGKALQVYATAFTNDQGNIVFWLVKSRRKHLSRTGTWPLCRRRAQRLSQSPRQARSQPSPCDKPIGMPDQTMLEQYFAGAVRTAGVGRRALAVLRIRFDSFHLFNDVLGHQAVSQFLSRLAARLRAALRPEDFAARSGRDEFVVLLENSNSPQAAIDTAQRISALLALPEEIGSHALVSTASIGISLFPQHGEHSHNLLDRADVALNRAQAAGNNSIRMFSGAMSDEVERTFTLDQSLRGAIWRDQFHLVYQPIADLGNGEVTSMEALLRWTLPDGTSVSPAEFIPLAERTGMIQAIGEWTLAEACRQAYCWRSRIGLAVPVAVNLSPQQLHLPHTANMILRTIDAAGITPADVELEITETCLMRDIDATLPQLRQLADAGVRLAIDDFGTGYSSLNYLRRLPVHTLKIDQSFIRDIETDLGARSIVRAIIGMADQLHLDTIGEGVENAQQMTILRQLGCCRFQGFHLAPPGAPGNVERLLTGG